MAGIGLVAAAPAMAGVAAVVRMRMGSPVLFRQDRVGRGGAPFVLLKFRTMLDAHDSTGAPLPDAERLTSFGLWLRSTSLDELPQLLNILRGDMSLVGPRPLLPEYLPLYTPRQATRHEVRPGLTGWAQVNGRNLASWDVKLEMDAWYVEHRSWRLDASILVRTVAEVLSGRGVRTDGHATAPRFVGTDPVRA